MMELLIHLMGWSSSVVWADRALRSIFNLLLVAIEMNKASAPLISKAFIVAGKIYNNSKRTLRSEKNRLFVS